ncbi:MAG TPA: PSD1 and planctomycete cytochrome C domain-containing protein [Verrucomicrobiae bacterium]|nr:PSD1 and planctomycete cytochrome C domain-containing protein [Verrucomicrobiae bacterium]
MREISRGVLTVCALVGMIAPTVAADARKPKGKSTIDFNRDIRPILSDHCFACHGPDDKARKAKLRFDVKEEAFKPAKSGDVAIVPGDPTHSTLVARITSKDEDEVMPPPKSGKKALTPEQIAKLKTWIAEGAQWQEHWAFVTPQRPPVPEVKNKRSVHNEIDHFVLARLEKERLTPAKEADKPTLIRRASLDLTGLPPTVEEVDAFLADKDPQAYDKVVDRLLNSPRYGEHMAKYWLDAARYADSHGYHIDSQRDIWAYRDWVINAFNANKPFDQFTVEQLAGDLLPAATREQKIGSGYMRCNMSTGEGGAIEAEYAAKYAFDRVETTSAIWMGLTMVCARCHTHKYDPIQHKEYYGLYAFFNNLDEPVMDNNKPNPDPFLRLPSKEQSERMDWLKEHIADGQKKIDGPAVELDQAQMAWMSQRHEKLAGGWTTLEPIAAKSSTTNGAALKVLEDQSVLAEGENPEQDVYELTFKPKEGSLAALRLETLPHESLPQSSSSRAEDGKFQLSEFEAEWVKPEPEDSDKPGKDDQAADQGDAAKGDKAAKTDKPDKPKRKDKQGAPQKLKFALVLADAAEGDHRIDRAVDGKADTSWTVDAKSAAGPRTALFVLDEPAKVPEDAELRVRLRFEASTNRRAIGHFYLAAAPEGGLSAALNPPRFTPWHVLGPFKSDGLQAGFEKVYEPEKEIDLKKKYPGVREEIGWTERGDLADGKAHVVVNELHGVHGVYYLHRTVRLPAPMKVELTLRADDIFKLWVNDRLVLQRADPDQEKGVSASIAVDLKQGENRILVKAVNHQGAKSFAFSQTPVSGESLTRDVAAILSSTKEPSGDWAVRGRNFYRRQFSKEFRELFENIEKWREQEAVLDKEIPTTLVAKESGKMRDTTLLMRGEYDKPGDKVMPSVPAILTPFPKDAPTNRLGLAQWLTDPAHPLTARVTVNRFWQQFFGVGLVKTVEDFGVQGDPPSHPELLDWLATEFVRSRWDMRHLQRLILTSATYRQTSNAPPDLRAKDPENRLLSRGPRFRADGEVIRDSALFISGLLVEEQGGQSVKPYEPPGLWETVSFNNSQKYVQDSGEGNYRRSLYTYWKRQSPPPNMMIFDAPTREYCVARRPRTNTPLQALALLNDPQFVEASRSFAQRILLEGGDSVESRIVYAFQLATARKPGKAEIKAIHDVLAKQLAEFRANKEAAGKLLSIGEFRAKGGLDESELAAWTTIATMILNLDEVVTKG